MKKNKKIKITILVLLVTLGINNLCSIAVSSAKYVANVPTAFTFKSTLTSLYKNDVETFVLDENKASKTGNFEFTLGFKRNTVVDEISDDVYEIVVPKDCTLENNGTGNLSDGKIFKFTSKDENKSNLSMSCPSTSSAEYGNSGSGYNFEIKIYEQIGKEQKFIYQIGRSIYEEIPAIIENPFTVPIDGSASETFLNKLKKYVTSQPKSKKFSFRDSEITNLVEKYVAGYSSSNFTSPLKGITMSSDSLNYTFSIDDNFLGYVFTSDSDNLANKDMFFTTTNEAKIKTIFDEYLALMFSPEEIRTITEYLANKKIDIAKFVLKNIPSDFEGITFHSSGRIDLKDLLEYIESFPYVPAGDPIGDDVPGIESNISTSTPSNSSVEVPVVASQNVNFGTDFVGTISNIRNNNSIYRDRISDNLVNTIVNDGTLLNEINSKVFGEQSDYEKYYIIKDESVNKYFALKVYRLNGINYFKIEDLQVNNYSVDDLKKLINISIDNVSFSSKKMIGVSITMDVTEFVRANPEATDAQIQGLFINVKNIVDKYLRKNYLTIVDNVEVIREDDGVSVRAKLNYQAKIY